MVDHCTFLAWLVQQTSSCNLAQLGFVARLADEFMESMLICRALTRPFVEACVTRLAEVRTYISTVALIDVYILQVQTTPAKEQLASLEQLLKSLVLVGSLHWFPTHKLMRRL